MPAPVSAALHDFNVNSYAPAQGPRLHSFFYYYYYFFFLPPHKRRVVYIKERRPYLHVTRLAGEMRLGSRCRRRGSQLGNSGNPPSFLPFHHFRPVYKFSCVIQLYNVAIYTVYTTSGCSLETPAVTATPRFLGTENVEVFSFSFFSPTSLRVWDRRNRCRRVRLARTRFLRHARLLFLSCARSVCLSVRVT